MFDSKDSKTIGYHLFLLPQSGVLQEETQRIINELAEKFGGPKFDSHATLLAHIPAADETELVEKTKRLANMMRPFEIELGEIVRRKMPIFARCTGRRRLIPTWKSITSWPWKCLVSRMPTNTCLI